MADIAPALQALSDYEKQVQAIDPTYNLSQGWYSPLRNMSRQAQLQHVTGAINRAMPADQQYNRTWAEQQLNKRLYGGMFPAGETGLNKSEIARQQRQPARQMLTKFMAGIGVGTPLNASDADWNSSIAALFEGANNAAQTPQKPAINKQGQPVPQHPLQNIMENAKAVSQPYQQKAFNESPSVKMYQFLLPQVYDRATQLNNAAQKLANYQQVNDAWTMLTAKEKRAVDPAARVQIEEIIREGVPGITRGLTKYLPKDTPLTPEVLAQAAQDMLSPEGTQSAIWDIVNNIATEQGTKFNKKQAVSQTASGKNPIPEFFPNGQPNPEHDWWNILHGGGMIGARIPKTNALGTKSASGDIGFGKIKKNAAFGG